MAVQGVSERNKTANYIGMSEDAIFSICLINDILH